MQEKPTPVFLLDVDGVLKKGSAPLAEGQKALDYLVSQKIEYVLVSNTTGDDDVVCMHLTKVLGRSISPSRFVASTTPLSTILGGVPPDTPVLVVGAPRFAVPYFQKLGMTRVFYTYEVFADQPQAAPQYAFCRSAPTAPARADRPHYAGEQIKYVIFHSDSTDWYCDIQIAVDCLANNGYLGCTRDQGPRFVPRVICSNPDCTYPDSHELPRMTLNSIVLCCQALVQRIHGIDINIEYTGKPYEPIFQAARQRLPQNGRNYKYYMIGDSLSSDIRGANQNGCESVLVLTGKDRDQAQYNPQEAPARVYSDVYEAVTSIMKEYQ